MPYCSLSCVRRWAFIVLDHCCKDLDIELIPGQHCPRHADTSCYKKAVSQPSSVVGIANGTVSHISVMSYCSILLHVTYFHLLFHVSRDKILKLTSHFKSLVPYLFLPIWISSDA